MDSELKKEFTKLSSFLKQWSDIWLKEVMNDYPESLNAYPPSWIKILRELNVCELWELDSGQNYTHVDQEASLLVLLTQIKKLSEIKKLKFNNLEFTPSDFFRVKDKKKHEIQRIVGFLDLEEDNSKSILDIGGGVGHLSRSLCTKLDKKSALIIEADKEFINIGKKINQKKRLDQISYKCSVFDINTEIDEYFDLCIGLHACGDLSSDLIALSSEKKINNILNFGCCYFKVKNNTYSYLSELGKKIGPILSKYSLTLASRAHTGLTYDAFLKKRKVKSFRYGLHLYLYQVLKIKSFKEVGESKFSEYQSGFESYANRKLKYLGIEPQEGGKLEEFFLGNSTQEMIEAMFLSNVIRWQFGRLIEKVVILDRCLFLEESGYKIKWGEVFDEKLSPRNIGIYATSTNE